MEKTKEASLQGGPFAGASLNSSGSRRMPSLTSKSRMSPNCLVKPCFGLRLSASSPPPSPFPHSFSLYFLSSSRFASLFHGSFTVDEEKKKEERLNLKLLSGLPIALRSLRQLIAPLTLINWISSQRDTGSDGVVKRNGRLSHPLDVLYSACCTRHTATWRKQRSIL